MDKVSTHHIFVFPYALHDDGQQGGNPATIFLHADGLTSTEMQLLAKTSGHECGFVLSGSEGEGSRCHLTMRYWVPNHEMEMCGHATVGAIWVMDQLGILPTTDSLRISTLSGVVESRIIQDAKESPSILVSQPAGSVHDLSQEQILGILDCLGLEADDLDLTLKVQNGRTSRTKTLIPVKNQDILNRLKPDPVTVGQVCEAVGSTGLYPYAVLSAQDQLVEARQFPKSSGYAEDPATGIAAAALFYSLLDNAVVPHNICKAVHVRQGWAMGKPSEIVVSPRDGNAKTNGCWISGHVEWDTRNRA